MWIALDPLAFAVPEVVRGIAWFVTAVAGPVILAVLGVVWQAKSARRKAMASLPPEVSPNALPAPTHATPTNPFGTDPSLTGRLLEAKVSAARAEWDLEEMRRRMSTVRDERDHLIDDVRRTSAQLARTQREADAARAKQATAEEAARQWRAIAELREQELAEKQREIEDLQARLPTPLRPPPIRR